MNIGFKNFRKFENFPSLELSPITILVGGNNAGKSTVVKALLAVRDFLDFRSSAVEYSDDEPLLDFDGNGDVLQNTRKKKLEVKFYFNSTYQTHIGTFKRALYNKAANNTIEFNFSDDRYEYTICVEGDRNDKDAVSGVVSFFKVVDTYYNIEYNFNQKDKTIKTIYHKLDCDVKNERLAKYNELLKHEITVEVPLEFERYYSSNSFIGAYIFALTKNGIRSLYRRSETNSQYADCHIEGLSEDDFYTLKAIYGTFFIDRFMQVSRIEYIYAHAVTQSIIYSAKDTNDYLVKTVHEFANLRLRKDSNSVKLIQKWMKAFNIGRDFKIQSVGGEAHIVKIINFDGEEVNLADKGMGSIQLMILLFRLATFIGNRALSPSGLVIVEEPEQNLHPGLQSKLADLFLDCYKNYRFRFLIETHSEYLVRKTQLLVAKKVYYRRNIEDHSCEKGGLLKEEIPFKVYYFPSQGEPYDMGYNENGMFERSFESGFFDEASELHLELLDLQDEKD